MLLVIAVRPSWSQNEMVVGDVNPGDLITLSGGHQWYVGANELPNASFDMDPAENEGIIPYWTVGERYLPMTTDLFSWSPSGGYDGGAYIFAHGSAPSNSPLSVAQRWRIEPHTHYYFSFYLARNSHNNRYIPVVSLTDKESVNGGENEEHALIGQHGSGTDGSLGYGQYDNGDWCQTACHFYSEEYTYLQFNARWLNTATSFDGFFLAKLYDPNENTPSSIAYLGFKNKVEQLRSIPAPEHKALAEEIETFINTTKVEKVTLKNIKENTPINMIQAAIAIIDSKIVEMTTARQAIDVFNERLGTAEVMLATTSYPGHKAFKEVVEHMQEYSKGGYYAIGGISTYEYAIQQTATLDKAINDYEESRSYIEPTGDALIVNEIQVSNAGMFIDPSFNYGGWIELYNATDRYISLGSLYVSDDPDNLRKHRLAQDLGDLTDHSYCVLWFDHYEAQGGTQYSDKAYHQIDFKLKYEGGTIYISDADGNIVTSQEYPAAIARTSYARRADGTWGMTATPTPGEPNEGILPDGAQPLPAPSVDKGSTTFRSDIRVKVQIPEGATLLYTTDGSVPTLSNGQRSTSGIFRPDKSTTYRFRLFQEGWLPSPVVTRTYIMDGGTLYLPIVSVAYDYNDVYGSEYGVFVHGKNGIPGNGINNNSNRNRNWDRPVNFEYMVRSDKGEYQMVVNQESEFETCGGWSRHYGPAPSFRLKASKYFLGQNSFEYPFFQNKPYLKTKALQIRNGGNDTTCRIKDAALHEIIARSGYYLDCQAWQPAHIFFNGKYMFMYNVREVNNKNYGYSNYGIDTDNMDQFELSGTFIVKVGDYQAAREWLELSRELADDPDNESLYERICNEYVDIDEYANYNAVQCFLSNRDWMNNNNNLKAFRDRDGGRFHFVFMDLDQAFDGSVGNNMMRSLESKLYDNRYEDGKNPTIEVFFNMLQCKRFRQHFLNAFCIVVGSVFEQQRAENVIDQMVEYVMPAQNMDGVYYNTTANSLKNDIRNNRSAIVRNLQNYFNIGNESIYTLDLAGNVPGVRLQLNGQDIPTGNLHGNAYSPVRLTASAPAGYHFRGWDVRKTSNAGKENIVSTDEEYTLDDDFDAGQYRIRAVYEPVTDKGELADIELLPVRINEVSASNTINVNTDYYKKDDWIELYNASDSEVDVAGMFLSDDRTKPQKYCIPKLKGKNTVIQPRGYLVVWASKREGTDTELHANFKLANEDGAYVMLSDANGTLADVLTYNRHEGTESVGRYPDGGADVWHLTTSTLCRTNMMTSYAQYICTPEPEHPIDVAIREVPQTTTGIVSTNYYTIGGIHVGTSRKTLTSGVYVVKMMTEEGETRSEKIIIR